MVQNANVGAAPPPKKKQQKKTQFLSFSCEDRSSVFLLWAKTITSVSTYGTSEKSRFVNLTETMTTRMPNGGQKSYADQSWAYTSCALYV